jgi:hypothetical protein
MASIVKRRITESVKKTIAGKQNHKCSASVEGYQCPLYFNGRDGVFDEAGYEIDHIEEFAINNNETDENLQALCIMCHRVKTKRFNQKNKKEKLLTKKNIYTKKIILFNGDKIQVKSYDLQEHTDVFIDKDNNIYQQNQHKKFRKIGNNIIKENSDIEEFKHIFETIEKPKQKLDQHTMMQVIDPIAYIDWKEKHGFAHDEYEKYMDEKRQQELKNNPVIFGQRGPPSRGFGVRGRRYL